MAQHDYLIANQSGAAFRADLNNALAAIVSQNSGAVEPSTTYAYMPWADITAGVLKIRNAANSAWVELLELDGEFGSKTFNGNITVNAQGDVRFADADSSNYVALQAPATVSSNLTLTLPSVDGTSGQRLKTNGSGVLSFGGANSGEIIKAQSFSDNGSSTTSTTLVNANGLYFNYTPASSNSKLLLIASFQAQITYLANTTTYGYYSWGESGTAVGATYVAGANSVAGIGAYTMGSIQASLNNTATTTRAFGIMHKTSSASAAVYSNAIYGTILEIAN